MDQFHIGVWYDYSQPSGDQGRFTLSKSNGNILLSFLTLLVTVAGASAWTILSLLIHSWIVRSRRDTDVLDVQQQITLRNAKSPLGTILDFLKLYRAWSKKKVPNVAIRTIFVLIPTLILYGGMLAASIFASKVAINKDGGGVALARDRGCGVLPLSNNFDDINQDSIRRNKITNDTISGRNYAINFYDNSTSTKSKNVRSTFVTDALPYDVDFNAPCPFKNSSLCLPGVSPISFESHELNSHSMFGINAKKADRIATRAKTTCTMINYAGYGNYTNGYNYVNMGSVGNVPYTYVYNAALVNYSIGYQIVDFSDTQFFASQIVPPWKPKDEFKVEGGDLTLLLNTQNWMRYSSPVKDPFFLATTEDPTVKDDFKYQPNYSLVPMMCIDSYMMCNPEINKCTPWAGYSEFFTGLFNDSKNDMRFNDVQRATAARMVVHMQQANINTLVNNLGSASLFASSHVYRNHYSTGLPDNQWHIEVTTWFQTKLAKFQASVAEYVSKPDDSRNLPVTKPDDPVLKTQYNLTDSVLHSLRSQCDSQMLMGTADIESFSLAGMLVIVIITVVLVIVSFFIKEIMDFCGRFVHGSRGHVARESDEKLHVLRHALSVQHGPQKWDLTGSIPVTEESQHVQWPKTEVEMKRYPSTERLVSNADPEAK